MMKNTSTPLVFCALLAVFGCADRVSPEVEETGAPDGSDAPDTLSGRAGEVEAAPEDDDEGQNAEVRWLLDPGAAGDAVITKDARAPRCGEVVRDARTGRALDFQGIQVYSNGACSGQGVSCGNTYANPEACVVAEQPIGAQPADLSAFDPTRNQRANRWQCVEFVKRVFAKLWGVHGWQGHAAQMLDTAPRGVQVRRQGDRTNPPQAGDAIVYSGGAYGHVALIRRVQGRKLFVIGQNEGQAQWEREVEYRDGFLSDRAFSMPIIGWAHATANGGGEAAFDDGDRTGEPVAPRAEEAPAGEPAAQPAGECDPRENRYWTCHEDRTWMFRCVGGQWETQRCAGGCRGQWWDDRCDGAAPVEDAPANDAPAPRATRPGAPADGDCNARFWNCAAGQDARYRCANGDVVAYEACPAGCTVMPVGQHDVCEDGRGGGDGWGEDVPEAEAPPRAHPVCIDACEWAGDGECDDGGPGALYAACELGTDCSDCGER
ncbi:MAG: CHAP domain-containing protein [Bradymonadia bacterium]